MFRKGLGMIFLSRHHHAVDQDAGILTCRAGRVPFSAILSTCTITKPPEFFAAAAMA